MFQGIINSYNTLQTIQIFIYSRKELSGVVLIEKLSVDGKSKSSLTVLHDSI